MSISACRLCVSRYLITCVVALLGLAGMQLATAQGASDNIDTGNERAAIEIIAIEHRDALLVRSRITPSLDPRGSIGVVDNKLIIASTAGNLAQLKTLIEQTDIPARRLVLSIDFAHSSNSSSALAQQSLQATEGQQVRFVAPSSGNAGQALPDLSMNASIVGGMARVDVDIVNVPGFTGRHQLNLTPGEWYVINPEEEPLLESELMGSALMEGAPTPGLDAPADFGAADLAAGLMSTQLVDNIVELAPIAVRVDVLP